MPTLWNPADRDSLRARVARLTPDSRAAWGKFDASGMLAHLVESGRMALGELPVKPKKLPLRYWPIKKLVIYVVPFPKGAPTAPELIARSSTDFAGDQRALAEFLDRFAAKESDFVWPAHPAFGAMTRGDWGALAYKHMDHHLTQFGL